MTHSELGLKTCLKSFLNRKLKYWNDILMMDG